MAAKPIGKLWSKPLVVRSKPCVFAVRGRLAATLPKSRAANSVSRSAGEKKDEGRRVGWGNLARTGFSRIAFGNSSSPKTPNPSANCARQPGQYHRRRQVWASSVRYGAKRASPELTRATKWQLRKV